MSLQPARLAAVLGVFLVFVVLAVAQTTAPENPGDEIPTPVPVADKQIKEVTDAVERFRKYDFDGALMSFKEARKKHPELSPGEVNMAKLFLQLQQIKGFRYWLEQAVVEESSDPEAYIFLGDMALREGRMCEATLVYGKANGLIATLSNAERKKALEPRIQSGLAAVAEFRKDWAIARKHLETWLKLDPKSANAMQRLARTLFQLKDSKGALDQLKAAKTADPKILNPAVQLGMLYEQAGDRENAKTWMDYALQTGAKDLATQLRVTEWLLQTEDLVRAEKQAAAAMQIDRDSLQAKILRGVVALFQKDYKSAEVYFESALLASPSNFAAKNNLALALCEQDDDAKKRRALAYASENAKLFPKEPEAASTYGWVLYKAGRVEEANKVLTQLARAGRVTEDTAYFIARVAADLGRKEEATTVLESALKSKRPFSKRDEAEALLNELQR